MALSTPSADIVLDNLWLPTTKPDCTTKMSISLFDNKIVPSVLNLFDKVYIGTIKTVTDQIQDIQETISKLSDYIIFLELQQNGNEVYIKQEEHLFDDNIRKIITVSDDLYALQNLCVQIKYEWGGATYTIEVCKNSIKCSFY